MLSSKAVTEFFNRELSEFDWLKSISPEKIDALLSEHISSDITKKLWIHQKACLLIMIYNPRFIFYIDMGGGKSALMLTILRHRKLNGEEPRAVVFVPFITAVDNWVQEVNKFAPELKCVSLLGNTSENRVLAKSNANILIVCYQSAVAMLSVKVELEDKNKWSLDNKEVINCFGGCDTVILDEIQKCKTSQSLTFRMCKIISSRASWVYGLTGTPFGRDLQDLWAQFYLVDKGETLGSTLSFYRAIFFYRKSNFWGGSEFKFKKRLTKKLQSILKNKSIRYSIDEFRSDVPIKQYNTKYISLSNSARSYVEKYLKELRQATKDKNYELAGNSFLQLRQLSSGFVTFKDSDNDERVKIEFEDNPKLDALCELIESMPSLCKMVVFHVYVFTNEIISKRLTKLKIDHARVWGGQKDQIGQITKFRNNPNCKVLLCNTFSSLNLQFANYVCFYEQPSAMDRLQAEARCWRSGQTKRVMIYDLFVNGTLDKKIHQANQDDNDFLKLVLDGKEEV